jgi:hypothetical protein
VSPAARGREDGQPAESVVRKSLELTSLGENVLGGVDLGDEGVVVWEVRARSAGALCRSGEEQLTLHPALGVLAIPLIDEVVTAESSAYETRRKRQCSNSPSRSDRLETHRDG